MTTRRDFVKLMAAAGAVGATPLLEAGVPAMPTGDADRAQWLRWAEQLAAPLLPALARRRLKASLPVEAADPAERRAFVRLEAFARLLCGLAPWLERGEDCGRWAEVAREALDAATDPASPDCVNFTAGQQPLVDAAFLAQALLRAPRTLWAPLPARVKANLLAGLKATRPIQPGENNWVLFASMVEAALHRFGERRDDARLFYGLRRQREWYVGDGWYGDGPEFHTDYYNSYVIQPMLVEVLDVIAAESEEWRAFQAEAGARLARFAAVQERLISPDGSYPVLGRSSAYRAGAFQGLALAAWRKQLPAGVKPAQVRRALGAVLRRTLEAPGTFDAQGWLRIGLAGAQPSLAEHYISTGSLYLCSTALLPLGLAATDPFWTDPAAPTTWEQAWSGQDLPADHALSARRQAGAHQTAGRLARADLIPSG